MKVISLVVGLTVGVLLMMGLVAPLVADHANETKTATNIGSYFTTPDEGEHTIVIDRDTITFDGKSCNYPDLSLYGSATAIIGEDWFLRLELNTGNNLVSYILAGPPQQYVNLGNSSMGALTVTINGDGFTTTNLSTSSEVTRSNVTWFITDKSDYVLSHDPYVLNDTAFVGAIRNVSNLDLFEIVTGTINTPAEYETTPIRMFNFTSSETGTFTSASYTVDLADVAGDLKKLNQITEQLTTAYQTDGEVTKTITIDYVIVPASITYDNPAYVGSGSAALLKVIPLMVGICLIAFAAFAVRGRMND